ncbi:MAG: hypothetical protein AAFV33_26785 [Chloroflexota bacterium]
MRFARPVIFIMLAVYAGVATAQTPVPTPVAPADVPTIAPTPTFEYNLDQSYAVVVARYGIWRGETITADKLMTIEVAGSAIREMEAAAGGLVASNAADIEGKVALCDVPAYHPVGVRNVVDALPTDQINCGKIPINVPSAQIETVGLPFEPGARGMLFASVDVNGTQLMLPVLNDVEILVVEENTLTLFVQDSLRPRTMLSELIANGTTLTLSPQPANFTEAFYGFENE